MFFSLQYIRSYLLKFCISLCKTDKKCYVLKTSLVLYQTCIAKIMNSLLLIENVLNVLAGWDASIQGKGFSDVKRVCLTFILEQGTWTLPTETGITPVPLGGTVHLKIGSEVEPGMRAWHWVWSLCSTYSTRQLWTLHYSILIRIAGARQWHTGSQDQRWMVT